MSVYRRWLVPGGTFFFTVVTHDRATLFQDPAAARLLGEVMRSVRARYPFRTVAVVLLPDHLHCIWTLPSGDSDFSRRWRWIKGAFTERWMARGGRGRPVTRSRLQKGEHGVWQRRFWEHQIVDELELEQHVDYIHYNPVKHGYVSRPGEWPWSSFLRHMRLGQYAVDWGSLEPVTPAVRAGE